MRSVDVFAAKVIRPFHLLEEDSAITPKKPGPAGDFPIIAGNTFVAVGGARRCGRSSSR